MPIDTVGNVWKWTKLTSTNKLLVALLGACLALGYGIVHIYSKQVAALEKEIEVRDRAIMSARQEIAILNRDKERMQAELIEYLKEQAQNKKEAKK